MADIFISYSREDEDRVKRIVLALEKCGWSVFWDRTIPVGQTWRGFIGNALSNASCVLVVWSKHSTRSEWVPQEADEAKSRNAYIPILLDPVLPPLGLRNTQAADLTSWNGDLSDPQFILLKNAIISLNKENNEASIERDTSHQIKQRTDQPPLNEKQGRLFSSDSSSVKHGGTKKPIVLIISAIIFLVLLAISIVTWNQSTNRQFDILDRNQTFSESAKRNIIASDGTFLAYIVDIPGDGRNVQLRIKGEIHIYNKSDEPFIINTENKNYKIKVLNILGNESKSIDVDILKKSN